MDSSDTENQDDFKLLTKIAGKVNPVYIAHSSLDNNIYAIKFFHYVNHSVSKFYKNESRFASLKNKHIIQQEECQPKYELKANGIVKCSYIMMELAPYGSFETLLKEDKLPNDIVLMRSFFKELVEGVSYLHHKNIAHMDLKLANLLLGYDYQLKIADFDCAVTGQNMLDDFMGTENFRAPEVIKRSCQDPKAADIYSLGIILFGMVNRRLPYDESHKVEGKDLYTLMKEQSHSFWEYHSGQNVTDDFKELFSWMVKVNPSERATLEDIRESKWYNEKSYNSTTVASMLKSSKKIHSLLEAKKKDS